jgi:stage V sporulation protein SpoVS
LIFEIGKINIIFAENKMDMATLRINYDANNKNAKNLVVYLMSLDFIEVKTVGSTSIDRSMEDLKNGRFYEAKDGADLIKQCLN